MKYLFVFLFLMTLASINTAEASDSLRQFLKNCEPLSLSYGVNPITLGKTKSIIIKGFRETGSAGSGDVFSTLVQDQNKWQYVYRDTPKIPTPVFMAAPHTYEDSLVSYRFFRTKATAKQGASLYVLESDRDMNEALSGPDASFAKPSRVVFTLYQLTHDEGIYSFNPIKNERTPKQYCNADWALYKELALPLPQDGNDYNCDR